MITSFLLFFANYALQTFVSFLPFSAGLPDDVASSLHSFGGYVGILDPILPITTMATVFALVVSFELAILTFNMLRWIVGYIPFIGKG